MMQNQGRLNEEQLRLYTGIEYALLDLPDAGARPGDPAVHLIQKQERLGRSDDQGGRLFGRQGRPVYTLFSPLLQ
jgi:hypothetical protein